MNSVLLFIHSIFLQESQALRTSSEMPGNEDFLQWRSVKLGNIKKKKKKSRDTSP